MAKNRVIPFGYRMENGKIIADNAGVVQEIFRAYLAGESMKQISDRMQIPYHDDSMWNGGCVRRVLSDATYLGTELYPPIIEPELFESVQKLKRSRATSFNKIPEDVAEVRRLSECKECGCPVDRDGGIVQRSRWHCRNLLCRDMLMPLRDEMIFARVVDILNAVIENPDLINSDIPEKSYSPNQEVVRQQNTVRRMMENPADYEHIKPEIYRLAELKYSCCAYSDVPEKTAELKSILSQTEKLNTLDIGLLKSCVRRILVSHLCTIEVEFINGVIIDQRGERV